MIRKYVDNSLTISAWFVEVSKVDRMWIKERL
jgi:hypothetical protein